MPHEQSNPNPRQRVLVIDDEPQFCLFMSRLISGLGYEVTTTSEVKSTYLDELEDSDIVFIDIMMPDMDGFQVLDAISRLNVNCSIILMSGAEDRLSAAEAMAKELGLSLIGVLDKPFRLRDIQAVLETE